MKVEIKFRARLRQYIPGDKERDGDLVDVDKVYLTRNDSQKNTANMRHAVEMLQQAVEGERYIFDAGVALVKDGKDF